MKNLEEQYVCQNCGYNMIGFYPKSCPFCGASSDKFITAEECSQKYKLVIIKVKKNINRLNSYPALGIEHSAYSIDINRKIFWIDCPSTFTRDLKPMDKIFFTHHHFLGASNLYREYYTAFIWIHKNDSEHLLSMKYPFDKKFTQDFNLSGIEAFHINGHTPGFTFYVFEDVLFICDYFFQLNDKLFLNPYGSVEFSKRGAYKLIKLLGNKDIDIVCGYNYVTAYNDWKKKLLNLMKEWNS